MTVVKRETIAEFHYALDGRNARRWPVGSPAEIRAEDIQRLGAEGKIALLPEDAVAQPLDLTDSERDDLPPLDSPSIEGDGSGEALPEIDANEAGLVRMEPRIAPGRAKPKRRGKK